MTMDPFQMNPFLYGQAGGFGNSPFSPFGQPGGQGYGPFSGGQQYGSQLGQIPPLAAQILSQLAPQHWIGAGPYAQQGNPWLVHQQYGQSPYQNPLFGQYPQSGFQTPWLQQIAQQLPLLAQLYQHTPFAHPLAQQNWIGGFGRNPYGYPFA